MIFYEKVCNFIVDFVVNILICCMNFSGHCDFFKKLQNLFPVFKLNTIFYRL